MIKYELFKSELILFCKPAEFPFAILRRILLNPINVVFIDWGKRKPIDMNKFHL